MNHDTVLKILPWLLPPFIGALIGYITNAVAIRMLFRPLTEKRIFGIKLPLTPGIIPKQRSELAESIGRMVSRELITEETIRNQISSENFQIRLKQNIESLIDNLLNRPLSELKKGNREALFSSIEKFLSESLFRFFSSRIFIHAARNAISTLVHALSEKRLEEILRQVDIGAALRHIISFAAGSELKKKLSRAVENWMNEQRKNNTPISEIIPEDIIFLVTELISSILPVLFDTVFKWLRGNSIQRELQTRGKLLLRNILDKLNVFQKFIVSAAQYDRTLEEKMPEIVEESINTLESAAYEEENRNRILQVIEDSLLKWWHKGSTELFARLESRFPAGAGTLIEKILIIFESEQVKEKIIRSLERLISGQNQKSLKELLARYFGVQDRDIIEFVSFHVLSYLSKRESARAIASEIVSFAMRVLEEEQDNTIADLLHIEKPAPTKAADYLADKLISILDQRLPALIQSFDIEELVVIKINQLEVGDVEKLLLMVISKHLKWINLFGAILGALIGVSQIILSLIQ